VQRYWPYVGVGRRLATPSSAAIESASDTRRSSAKSRAAAAAAAANRSRNCGIPPSGVPIPRMFRTVRPFWSRSPTRLPPALLVEW